VQQHGKVVTSLKLEHRLILGDFVSVCLEDGERLECSLQTEWIHQTRHAARSQNEEIGAPKRGALLQPDIERCHGDQEWTESEEDVHVRPHGLEEGNQQQPSDGETPLDDAPQQEIVECEEQVAEPFGPDLWPKRQQGKVHEAKKGGDPEARRIRGGPKEKSHHADVHQQVEGSESLESRVSPESEEEDAGTPVMIDRGILRLAVGVEVGVERFESL
jgi:hypothetical protein